MNKAQIITRITPGEEPQAWQHLLSTAICDPGALLKALELPADLLPGAQVADGLFRLRVTHSYLERMEKGNPADPLLLQVLPQLAESSPQPDHYSDDPVGDQDAMQTPGLLHKYQGRVLLIATEACAIHCRYCFRREFPYQDARAGKDQWKTSLDYIAADASIEEVILSGGDPLVLSDNKLSDLIERLAAIRHVKRLRIHSRLPIVLPQRITSQLIDWISQTRLQVIMVVHSNHPQEINTQVGQALQLLYEAGVTLLNQSVLLHNINDDSHTLAELSQILFENRTLPYYLHTLDAVRGAAHFAVPVTQALEIQYHLSTRLPGYLVPKLAREVPGMPAKSVITGIPGPFF